MGQEVTMTFQSSLWFLIPLGVGLLMLLSAFIVWVVEFCDFDDSYRRTITKNEAKAACLIFF